jgi:hypothetical protein
MTGQESTMKKLSTALSALILIATTTSALATPVCLDSYRIKTTTVPDSKHILFHMIDGTVWRNELKAACPGLRFNGFVYAPTASRSVCENLQTIRVIDDGSPCLLGRFEKVSSPTHT